VWINTHGGVLAGIGLASIGLLAGVMTGRAPAGGRRRELVRAAGLIGLLCTATLANPYGVHLPWFLVTKVAPHVPITEWAAVDLGDVSFPLFKAMVLALAIWLVVARRARLPETMIIVAPSAPPPCCTNATFRSSQSPRRRCSHVRSSTSQRGCACVRWGAHARAFCAAGSRPRPRCKSSCSSS
jgi:hypothetical protein